MASETQPLLGSVKRIRAIKDLVYQGKAIRGRRFTKVDGRLGSYEIIHTAGEELECDQAFAKEAVMAGKAELVSGGNVEVIPQADGFPIYKSWLRNLSDPAPVFERCEILKPQSFGDGCHLSIGFKCRLDTATFWDRSRFCYEDETLTDQHAIRVLKLSPKKLRMSQAEQQAKTDALFSKFFPANA